MYWKRKMQLKKNVARDMISDGKISIFYYNGNEFEDRRRLQSWQKRK